LAYIVVPNEIKNQIIYDYKKGDSVLALTKKYGYKYDKIYSLIQKENIPIRGNNYNSKRYYNDSQIFDNIDTEEKAYWLGFLYADGCVVNTGSNLKVSLALSAKDISHLEKFQRFMRTNNPIRIYNGNHHNQYCRLYIIDEHLCKQLIDKGVYINKTEIISFPNFLSEEMIRHFIRGYVDGDGCITYHKHKNNINRYVFAIKICSTKEMLYGINNYLPLNNKKKIPKLQKRRKNEVNNYSLEYGGNKQTLNILNYLYQDANIYLDRKYERYLLLKNLYS